MLRRIVAGAVVLMLPVRPVFAHGARVDPETWWTAWSWDPLVLLSLGLLAWLYLRGICRLRCRIAARCPVQSWQVAAYFVSLALLFVALLSPLDALSEELSCAHMVQHMLLMIGAAPLFVLGAPDLALVWAVSERGDRQKSSWLRRAQNLANSQVLWNPFFAWALFGAVLWVWHHPRLYEMALREPIVHDIQHISFFSAAGLFWRVALDSRNRRRIRPIAIIPYLFATSVHASALGVFLALSPGAWYAEYDDTTLRWGLTPLEDQQLAGALMWIPGCLVYPAIAAVLSGIWLTKFGRPSRRRSVPSNAVAQRI